MEKIKNASLRISRHVKSAVLGLLRKTWSLYFTSLANHRANVHREFISIHSSTASSESENIETTLIYVEIGCWEVTQNVEEWNQVTR